MPTSEYSSPDRTESEEREIGWIMGVNCTPLPNQSVRFPGAVDSQFTTDMSFIKPSDTPAIPTYRIMDSDGIVVDKNRVPLEITEQEVVTWYKNMMIGVFCIPRLPYRCGG